MGRFNPLKPADKVQKLSSAAAIALAKSLGKSYRVSAGGGLVNRHKRVAKPAAARIGPARKKAAIAAAKSAAATQSAPVVRAKLAQELCGSCGDSVSNERATLSHWGVLDETVSAETLYKNSAQLSDTESRSGTCFRCEKYKPRRSVWDMGCLDETCENSRYQNMGDGRDSCLMCPASSGLCLGARTEYLLNEQRREMDKCLLEEARRQRDEILCWAQERAAMFYGQPQQLRVQELEEGEIV